MLKVKLEDKVKKHKEKLQAHKDSKLILDQNLAKAKEEYEYALEKVASTERNIEYHTGKLKAYQEAARLLNE